MRVVLLVALLAIVGSCDTDNTLPISALDGMWVEKNTKTDTLIFGLLGDRNRFILHRGKELSNGLLLPKPRSGHYDFKLSPNTISVRWMLSSSGAYQDCFIHVSGRKMSIGDFYSASSPGVRRHFERVN